MNLDIRSANTEARLIKYATRGFALRVKGLDRGLIDRDYLQFKRTKDRYNDGGFTYMEDGGWDKWADASGLLRLLLAGLRVRSGRRARTRMPV
jgi:hypothetical protein